MIQELETRVKPSDDVSSRVSFVDALDIVAIKDL
jgi:hypothetical protein